MFNGTIIQIEPQILLLNLSLWIINISLNIYIILYIFFKLYIKKYSEEERKELNVLNLTTWLLFLLLICVANIITLFFRFVVIEESLGLLLEGIAIILVYIAIFIKVLYLENLLHKLKYYKRYYVSIISFINIIIFFFITPTQFKEVGTLQYILLILIAINFSFLPILYLFLSIKTTGENRRRAFEISAGAVFLGLGLLLRPLNLEGYYGVSELLNTLIIWTYITAPISILIAMILIFDSIHKRKEK